MGDLVADAILWGTTASENGGAQIALMNVGGVRASLDGGPKYTEGPGQITYAEAYDVAPFGNLLPTLDLTGAQIKAVLEQQYIRRSPGRLATRWRSVSPTGFSVHLGRHAAGRAAGSSPAR